MNFIAKHASTYYRFASVKIQKLLQGNRLRKAMDYYESYIGISEIKSMQTLVLKAEKDFVESTKARRAIQDTLLKLQDELKQIRHKLDSTSRSDEVYLELITNEHKLMKNEINLLNSLRSQEELERELFTSFSQRLREAHEFERLRQEKVKYLSVYGSVAGALVGIIGTSINHTLKMKDINTLISSYGSQLDSFVENISSRLDSFDHLITQNLTKNLQSGSKTPHHNSQQNEFQSIKESLVTVNQKFESLTIKATVFSIFLSITLVALTFALNQSH